MKNENIPETIFDKQLNENIPKIFGKSKIITENSEKIYLIRIPKKHFPGKFSEILNRFRKFSVNFWEEANISWKYPSSGFRSFDVIYEM